MGHGESPSTGGAGFDRIASHYDRWYEKPANRYIDHLEERTLEGHIPPGEPGSLLLDVGFGTGHTLDLARRAGYTVVGLDRSGGMLGIAASKAGMDAPLVQGDAHRLPFPDACFEVVLSVTALEFFDEPNLAVEEMARCLKPEGTIVIGVLNAFSYLGLQRKILRKRTFRRAHFYRVKELKHMLSRIGAVKIDTCAFMPPWEWLLPAGDRLEIMGKALAPCLGHLIVASVSKPAPD